MKWLVITLALTGCGVHNSRIGPYVTDVQRHGNMLVVSMCDIILESGELQTGTCQEQRLPIAGLPIQQAPGEIPPALAPGAPPPAH